MDLNEYKSMLSDEYRRNRAEGMSHHLARKTAKATVNAAYPREAEFLSVRIGDNSSDEAHRAVAALSWFWTTLRQEFGDDASQPSQPAPPPPPTPPPASVIVNGGGKSRTRPGLILYASGYSNITDTVLAALRQMQLTPGDVLHLGDMRFWSYIVGCSPAAMPNLLQGLSGQSALSDAGYKFQPDNVSYSDFSVAVVNTPTSERQREISSIEAKLAELQQELIRLREK